MTRKEAIEILKHEKDNDIFVCTEYRNKIHEALEMAIKALDQEPTTKNDLGVDCISRQAVLELLEDTNNGWIINEVLQLPSVTPQEPFKPMVEIDLDYVIKQKYIEREVLDKIRAELHATAEMHADGDYYLREEWIDEIFDKYKTETEAE